MNAEFEAPEFVPAAIGLIAGGVATVFSSALEGVRASAATRQMSDAEYFLQCAHVERSRYEREVGLHRQTQMEKEAVEDQLAEALAGLARLTIALRGSQCDK